MLVTLGLLLASTSVALHAEERRDLSADDGKLLLGALSSAIQRRTGVEPAVSDVDASACVERAGCLRAVLERTGAKELVPVRILAVPSKIRVIAELRDGELRLVRRAQVDLARDRAEWPASLDAVALALFPLAVEQTPAIDAPPAPPPPPVRPIDDVAMVEPASRTWPWWLVGGGAVAGGVALAFGAANADARDEGTRPGTPPDRVEELRDTTRSTGLAANVLFGVAATSLITGAVFLVVDE